ncbi:hypothetical protein PG1528B_1336 [Bifidobacterium animalis subsp. lactis]|nr:hypothetical protein PG1528B_1336 [Bifidobacterium animalis subsp. lactis]
MRGTPSHHARRSSASGIIPALAGNTNEIAQTGAADVGSSPRLRGTQTGDTTTHHPIGIIPALAGNTDDALIDRVQILGSSPRLRGTPVPRAAGHDDRGIIPALAGNTCPGSHRSPCRRDHPRACGEHGSASPMPLPIGGSSPRLRGTPRSEIFEAHRAGIIPALAGNTVRELGQVVVGGDHPRACGEHDMMVVSELERLGSSPRLRGTRMQTQANMLECGIIPALAGNTKRSMTANSTCRDHPRACGEHQVQWSGVYSVPGIIPALAGNTLATCRCWACSWDHPRACGEHDLGGDVIRKGAGSSPRLRGTRDLREDIRRGIGIIPALAGNTSGRHSDGNRFAGSSPRLRGTLAPASQRPLRIGIIPALAGNTATRKSSIRRAWDHPRACGEHTKKSQ